MRWERLFADLSAELDASTAAELESELAERVRSERSKLRLVDRLRGSVDLRLDVHVLGVGVVSGTLLGVGPDWCLLQSGNGVERAGDHVVRLGAVLEVGGLAGFSAAPGSEGVVAARFSLAAVIRHLARDRAVVGVIRTDGRIVTGTVELSGADFLEMTERRADEPGWARGSGGPVRRTIPIAAVAAIRQ